ncbi:MAG: PTS sugar transporter subunit IIA [Desulfobacula sp.]|nr:PTS sugar transporter subunit IIA [Desulfobacula sp.]
MKLSIIELSQHLGVATNTIERWIKQGKLPVSPKGVNYQFHLRDLEKWASKNNINLNLKKNGNRKEKESNIPLATAVQNGGIYFDIQGHDIKSVLNACLEKISDIPDDFKIDLFDRLLEREKALSTGVGNGIAIPHPREPLVYLNTPIVSACFLNTPVDYKAIDNQPVSILFILLCPSLNMHLHLLSALSFCLRDNMFVNFLKSRPDPNTLIEKITILQKTNLS